MVWELRQRGLRPHQTRSALKRAKLRPPEARLLAAKSTEGVNKPWAPLSGPRRPGPRGPRKKKTDIPVRAAHDGARAPDTRGVTEGDKTARRPLWGGLRRGFSKIRE